MSRFGLALVALALLACVPTPAQGAASKSLKPLRAIPEPPVWPDKYETFYVFSIPYTASLQPTVMKYPVHVYYDGLEGKLRLNILHGLDETIILPNETFEVYPRILTPSCLTFGGGSAGPTGAGANPSNKLDAPLPSLAGWEYAGESVTNGKPCNVWQFTERHWEKVNTYTFHVSKVGNHPVHLTMVGVNLFSGSHYDHYDVAFEFFVPGLVSDYVFRPPPVCTLDPSAARTTLPAHAVLGQATSVLPAALVPGPRSVVGSTGVARAAVNWLAGLLSTAMPGLVPQPAPALGVAAANLAALHEWNKRLEAAGPEERGPVAAADLYRVAPNHFTAVTDEHWAATRFGHTSGGKAGATTKRRFRLSDSADLGEYVRVLSDDQLPASVDWRGTGADGPVKDQASCGSCWAFGTSGAMTGAWWKATGESLSFSEQQIVDCSWDYEVNGCWGGDAEPALSYIAEHGGIALEADYPYLGQNSFCKENLTHHAAKFKGFKTVPADEKAVMEAVALNGPLYVAFDADHFSFKYYSEGVYYNKDCGTTIYDLDHAVVLVGYGTTPDGTDYWEVKNSWGGLWGSDGYFKMARKGNDCGMTQDVVMAVVDEDAAAAAKARMASTKTTV